MKILRNSKYGSGWLFALAAVMIMSAVGGNFADAGPISKVIFYVY